MSEAGTEQEQPQRKSFAEVARLIALQLSKQRGFPSPLYEAFENQTQSCPDEIIPRLYLGDFFHASDERILAQLRITHVVSVIETCPTFNGDIGNRLDKLHVSIRDSSMVNIMKHFDNTTEFIRNALKDPSSAVLVHCFQGISRSASIVAAYLLATQPQFTTAEEAVRFLQTRRRVVLPNSGFMDQLARYAIARAVLRNEAEAGKANYVADGEAVVKAEAEQVGMGEVTAVAAVLTSTTKEASDTWYTEQS